MGGGNSNVRILRSILAKNDTVHTLDLRCVHGAAVGVIAILTNYAQIDNYVIGHWLMACG